MSSGANKFQLRMAWSGTLTPFKLFPINLVVWYSIPATADISWLPITLAKFKVVSLNSVDTFKSFCLMKVWEVLALESNPSNLWEYVWESLISPPNTVFTFKSSDIVYSK